MPLSQIYIDLENVERKVRSTDIMKIRMKKVNLAINTKEVPEIIVATIKNVGTCKTKHFRLTEAFIIPNVHVVLS